MRRLKLQVQMSVDGFVAGPNSEMDWLAFNWDDQLSQYVTELNESIDCIILGRKLAEGFIPHWAAKPEREDPAGVEKMNNTPKVVFGKTLTECVWPNTVLAKGDLVQEINTLKQQEGRDIITYGGASFVSALISHNLIDEYHLFINPTAIGNGLSIFRKLDHYQKLMLKKSIAFPCGIVVLQYEPFLVA
jgi:dihydrofolate reductase